MTQAKGGMAEVPGGTLAWEVAGDGPGVVLLHPGLWDSRVWDEQFATFSGRYRVVRYDLRGYGRSSRPVPGQAYSHVADLLAVMAAAGLERAALVGNSLGGRVAVDAALTDPERVSALVLAAANVGGFEETEEEAAAYADVERAIEEAIQAGDARRAMELELSVWTATLGTDDAAGARIRQIAFDNVHVVTMDESGAARLDDAFARLAAIRVPTLVLTADHDPPVFGRLGRAIAERIADARFVELEDCDHVMPLRRPDAFDRVVLAFLGDVL